MNVFVITRTEGDYDLQNTVYESLDALHFHVEATGMHKDFEVFDAAELQKIGYLVVSEVEVLR